MESRLADVLDRSSIALHGIRTVTGRYGIGALPAVPGNNLFGCRLRMISSDAFRVTAPVIPQPDDRVFVSFGPLGDHVARVERQLVDGFTANIEQNAAQRTALTSRIEAFSENI